MMGDKSNIGINVLKGLKRKITQILEERRVELLFEGGLIDQLEDLNLNRSRCVFSAHYLSRLASDIKDMNLVVIEYELDNGVAKPARFKNLEN